jgi:hypothetical protein
VPDKHAFLDCFVIRVEERAAGLDSGAREPSEPDLAAAGRA